jgi:peptidyl-prolyl cis-trans isomerase SurA
MQAFKKIFYTLCFLGCCGVVIAQDAQVVDRIVAVVNNDIIVLFELEQAYKPFADKIRTMGYPAQKEREMLYKVRRDILDKLIDQKLTDQEIKRAKITVADKDIDSTLERIKEEKMITEEELRKGLAAEGLTLDEYRTHLKDQMLRRKLVNREIQSKIVITDGDISGYYTENRDKYSGIRKYHLYNIIMRVSPYAGEAEKGEALKKMEEIHAQFAKGRPFETLIAQYTQLPSINGGEIGQFALKELSPQLQKVLKSLEPEQVTTVVDTDLGYQIFYIKKIIETPGKSLEEAAPEIQKILFNQIIDEKFNTWIEELRARSHIKIKI